MNSSYPPVISAIRNIAVNGACITPAISPAMPTRAKLLSDNDNPKLLSNFAKNSPAFTPVKSAGAKTPPTPPLPKVDAVATTLTIMTITKNTATVIKLLPIP